MLFNIAGVVADGTTPVTATAARTDLMVYQGVDTFLAVTVTGSSGVPINLTSCVGVLTIRDRVMPNQGTPSVLQTYVATLTAPATGLMTFIVPGAFIKALLLKSYFYDVFLTNASGYRDEVIPVSQFSVQQSIGA